MSHRDVICCAALLELRQKRQAERMALEYEMNMGKNKYEQTAENGETMQPVSACDDKPCGDTLVSSEQNAHGDGEIVEIPSEAGEGSSKDGVNTVTAVECTDIPDRLDQLEKLRSSPDNTEQCEPHTHQLPPDTDQEVLQLTDGKLNKVQGNGAYVTDLSNVTPQLASISGSQHATTVCFEVCFQKAVLCVFAVDELCHHHHHLARLACLQCGLYIMLLFF